MYESAAKLRKLANTQTCFIFCRSTRHAFKSQSHIHSTYFWINSLRLKTIWNEAKFFFYNIKWRWEASEYLVYMTPFVFTFKRWLKVLEKKNLLNQCVSCNNLGWRHLRYIDQIQSKRTNVRHLKDESCHLPRCISLASSSAPLTCKKAGKQVFFFFCPYFLFPEEMSMLIILWANFSADLFCKDARNNRHKCDYSDSRVFSYIFLFVHVRCSVFFQRLSPA